MRLWPRSLKGQLIGLSLLALLASQIAPLLFILHDRQTALTSEWLHYVLLRTANVADLLETTPGDIQPKILKSSSSGLVRFNVSDAPGVKADDQSEDPGLLAQLEDALGEKAAGAKIAVFRGREDARSGVGPAFSELWEVIEHVFALRPAKKVGHHGPPYAIISLPLKSGQWLNAVIWPRPILRSPSPLIVQLVSMIAFLALAVIVVMDRVLRPLKDLAEAAKAVGRGERNVMLAVEGPKEVAETIGAFNEMQDRLSRFVGDRTKMLAALSHDLRTPITSLRLRAEFIEDEEVRAKILETLDEMQQMAEATLSFAREEAAHEEARVVDFGALIGTVSADFSDVGRDVEYQEIEGLTVRCRPVSLKRALRNVIENAVTYGKRARVSVRRLEHDIVLYIDDDGPGIPDGDIEKVFKPFVRLEGSRNRQTGGAGLGLAIARSIIRGHGGDIELANREGGGLRATITLPISMREEPCRLPGTTRSESAAA